jgi:uroporphyrinogen-III synthase
LREKEVITQLEEDHNREVAKLKNKLVDKLMILVSGKTSQGVYNNFKEELIPKKAKFTQKTRLASIIPRSIQTAGQPTRTRTRSSAN